MTQVALMSNGEWRFSVIDHGYGSEKGLFEVGLWEEDWNEGVGGIMVVKGWLDFEEVLILYSDFRKSPIKLYKNGGFS